MLEYMEDFMNDYLDGKVNKENYPHAYKVMDALQDTTNRLERDVESGDTVKVLEAIAKITAYASNAQKGHAEKDYASVNKAIETFTGVEVDIDSAREELKTYAKAKIDQM